MLGVCDTPKLFTWLNDNPNGNGVTEENTSTNSVHDFPQQLRAPFSLEACSALNTLVTSVHAPLAEKYRES
ncbi:unnamed protein product [Toxocara canis]|uniref:Uncharacterized protein n=1 Tax=Toxocara canis TaxID=6265 RepID=A0A183U353_TOXCA|nr:unnamed protein product [Toxocara canis]